MNREDAVKPGETESGEETYVAPEIERVITQEDLEREVHYAGAIDASAIGR